MASDTPTGTRRVEAREDAAAHSRWWLEVAVIVVVFFIVGGAPAPHVNETHYLAKAKHYWDPSYCAGDFFLNSADPHLVFYWAFGWVTRLASLTAAAWIGRIAAWLFIAVAWKKLIDVVLPAPWIGTLCAGIWLALIERANFAGEWVVGGVEAKCFAYALVLLGLADMARGKWSRTWVWFGAASAFHVLVGAWAVVAAIGVWLTESRPRPTLRTQLPALFVGGMLALPGLIPALLLERNADPAMAAEAARIYVFERLPHHLAPLSLPAEEVTRRLVRFGIVAGVMIAAWIWSWRRGRVERVEADERLSVQWRALQRIMRFAGFALIANGVGLAIETAFKNDALSAARELRYYWFRQADFAVPLAVAIGIGVFVVHTLGRRRLVGTVVAVISTAACLWFLGTTAALRWREPEPPAVAKIDDVQSWQQACAWIAEHTPPNSRFLIPRAGYSFKWYASRADVVNYKDVPQDAASVVQWRARMRANYPQVNLGGAWMTLDSPEELGTKRVGELARRYVATHVLARRRPALRLKQIYPPTEQADSYYVVYETGVAAETAR